MSRTAKNIEKDKLEAIIVDLESKNTYTNRSSLFTEVAEKYNTLHGINFSHSCASARAEKFNIILKTPKGERGNPTALEEWKKTGIVKEVKPKADTKQFLAFWSKEAEGKYYKLAKRAARGNMKAAVILKCLDCSNLQKKEITLCQCPNCPLFLVRPYQ